MTAKQIKNRGFTLVELLIVIVVIAILTIISLVAYNGVQNQARTTTAESTAKSVADKAQIYYTEHSKYPDSLDVLTGAAEKETYSLSKNAVIKADGTSMTASPGKNANTILYQRCNEESALITYWNYTENKAGYRRLGTLKSDATSCSTAP